MCPEEIVLSAYFDGELSTDQTQVISLHIEECPVCRGNIDRLEARQKALMLLAENEISSDWTLDRLLHCRVSARRMFNSTRGVFSLPRVALAMIVAALVLSIGINLYSLSKINNMKKPAPFNMMLSNIKPSDVDEFFTLLENSQGFSVDNVHYIPVDLPAERFGQPQFTLDKPEWKKP